MQQRQILSRNLQKLQEECINEYFQTKLEALTSKEVIRDIIQGFVAINNEQFFQSIAQTIDSVKKENQQLQKRIIQLEQSHLFEIQALRNQLNDQQLRDQESITDLTRQFEEQIRLKEKELTMRKDENMNLLAKLDDLRSKSNQWESKQAINALQVSQLRQKMQEMGRQNSKLAIQLQKTRQASTRFKQSCEKLLKQTNKERQKVKDQLIQDWSHEREIYEKTQQQLRQLIQQKDYDYQQQKATQQQQFQAQLHALKGQIQTMSQKMQQFQSQQQQKFIQAVKAKEVNQQLGIQITQLEDRIKKAEHQKQSLNVANLLLQEQNKYLRSSMISFDQRYQLLAEQKHQTQKSFRQFKAQKENQIDKLLAANQQLKQQNKLETQATIKETQQSLKQIAAELQFLKQRQEIYKENQNGLTAKVQEYQNQLLNYQQENKCLSQQLKLHFTDTQVHQNEIKLYEDSILQLNQQFRAQLLLQKQSFQASWNRLNQQLLEQKYKKSLLSEQIQKCRQQIALHQQKEQIYELYNQEISQLKAQLQLINTYQQTTNIGDLKFKDFKSKFYFYISKANEDIKKLRKDNKFLKEAAFQYINDYKTYLEEFCSVIILKMREQSLRCILCEHQKSLKHQQKVNSEQIMFKKTLPKLMKSQGMNYSNIKKALKNINQRCQSINQQNKQYTEHIDGVIKKI